MKKLISTLMFISFSSLAIASTDCVGKIHSIYKWNTMTALSARIKLQDGTITNWVSLPTKSDEAMVMMALAANKDVELYWASDAVTACVNGWPHNTSLYGYIVVTN